MSKHLAPTLDLLVALRYVFYNYKIQIISDKSWDDMKFEEIEYGGGGPILKEYENPRLIKPWIKSLGLYLCDKFKAEGKAKWLK